MSFEYSLILLIITKITVWTLNLIPYLNRVTVCAKLGNVCRLHAIYLARCCKFLSAFASCCSRVTLETACLFKTQQGLKQISHAAIVKRRKSIRNKMVYSLIRKTKIQNISLQGIEIILQYIRNYSMTEGKTFKLAYIFLSLWKIIMYKLISLT